MTGLRLLARQVRYTNRAFWRNPAAAFFTFAFPLMFLVIFSAVFGGGTARVGPGRTVSLATFYVPSIAAFSLITACYTNIAMSVAVARDEGVLKRIRGTPIPPGTYLAGRVVHAVLVALLLVALCVAFGALAYGARVPVRTLPAFALTVVVGAGAFSALGLAVTAAIPNADAAPAIVNASVLPLLFVSDVFVVLPPDPPLWMDVLGKAFPVRHFADAMQEAFFTTSGSGLRPGDLVVVAVWGVAGMLLAVRFFSWEPRR